MNIDAPTRQVMVVIPTLNEAKTIATVINNLAGNVPADTNVRIVVVDGCSTDGTPDIVRRIMKWRPNVELLRNPRRIQSVAVNRAADMLGAGVDVLVRCDAHAEYPPDYVGRLLKTLDETGADAVVVPMDSKGRGCFQRAVAWVSNTPVGSGGSAHRGGRRSGFVDHGHHAAIRMDSFRRAGGYDETFTHNEDAELDCRQSQFGSRIYLDGETRLGYFPRSHPVSLWRQYFAYGRGRSRTVRRHPGSMRLRQLAVPVHVVAVVLMLIASVWSQWLVLWPSLYAAVLLLTSSIGIWRLQSACGIFAGVAAGIMHVSWAFGFFAGLIFVRQSAWLAQPVSAREEMPAGVGTP